MTKTSLYHYLKHNQIFANLNDYAFNVVENYLHFRSLEAGEVLFSEGQVGDFMAFVVVGKLAILKKNNQAEMIHLTTINVGDSFGEMAIIDELSRSATAQAIEKSGLIILPKADFDRILQDHPRIGINMLKGIATLLSLNLRRTSESLSRQMH